MKVALAHHDGATTRMLRSVLLSLRQLTVAWTADAGDQVLEACSRQAPDLLLLDLELIKRSPGGLVQQIMLETPCPILLLDSASGQNVRLVFQSLGHGATDVAAVPDLSRWGEADAWAGLLAQVSMLWNLSGHRTELSANQRPMPAPARTGLPPVVAIGSSTGGPKALAALLSRLPAHFPAAVVIVQHLDSHFVEGLASSLNEHSPLDVAALTRPTALKPGKVWVAARPEHLVISSSLMLDWTDRWPELICRPAIDVFFKSLAEHPELKGCGLLLTGMGRDGAEGLLAMRKAGFSTAAQDADSSVVYGMPKAAAELGAAEAILPIEQMADWLVDRINRLMTPGQTNHRSTEA